MNIAIEEYIGQTYTLEMADNFNAAIALFERLNINSYEAFFLNELAEKENKDSEFLGSSFYYYLTGFVAQFVKEFGFTLLEDVTFENQVKIVSAYVALEDYIDNEAVIRICENDTTDSEKFAEMVALITDIDSDNVLSMIEQVDPASIITVQRIHIASSNTSSKLDDILDQTPTEGQVRQFKAFKLFLGTGHPDLKIVELIRSGYDLGLPFSIYWQRVVNDLITEETEITGMLAKEILGLMMASNEFWSNPMIGFEAHANNLWDNPLIVGKLSTLVRVILGEFDKFKSTNRIK